MQDLVRLEGQVQQLYEQTLQPLADRLVVDLPRRAQEAPSLPIVLFLGNHSSGKSSFINGLIGAERQKTGLAPTDDGFTVLTYGSKEDELDGQSVVSHPELAFRRLEKLGPTFLSRLRLKTHPAEILRSISLIDSPGMIDAAGTARGRGYDFAAGVRAFAEMADLVLFFFDPDKPGTTGETVSIFTETLVGLEHKLLIVMNKVDLFSNIRDFARTYGTLCWNLSKTMKTKDVPHIFNMYLPEQAKRFGDEAGRGVPLKDFDASREEVVAEIHRAPTRRADNLVSDLLIQARSLSMHGRVGEALARHYRGLQFKIWGALALVVTLGALGAGVFRQAAHWTTPFAFGASGVLLAVVGWFAGQAYLRREEARLRSAEGVDPFFEGAYQRELTWQDRADLRALWERVRPKLVNSVVLLGAGGLPRGFALRRQLRRLDTLIDADIPKLRRSLRQAGDGA
jgi:hypothetical protein